MLDFNSFIKNKSKIIPNLALSASQEVRDLKQPACRILKLFFRLKMNKLPVEFSFPA